MATYVPGSKSYMPEFKPFTPDYKFLSTVLDTKTNRYNTNYKQLNDLYSKIVYAPLSREDTQFMRDQYTEGLSDKLEKISGMDLSLVQNVDTAKAVFKPFFEEDIIVRDMVMTKTYQNEQAYANRLLNDPDRDRREMYWQTGIDAMNYRMQDFINADADAALGMALPKYVPDADLYELALDVLEESGLSVKKDILSETGQWVITQENGELVTGPALEMVQRTLWDDPRVQQAYYTQSFVEGRKHAEQGINNGTFANVDQGQRDWALNTIAKYQVAGAERAVEDRQNLEDKKATVTSWDLFMKKYGIVPGSKQEREMKRQYGEYAALQQNLETSNNIISEASMPTDGQSTQDLLNRAYNLQMQFNMKDDMIAAARAYGKMNASTTIKMENPEYARQRKFQYDKAMENIRQANRMALAKYESDLEKEAEQGLLFDSQFRVKFGEPGTTAVLETEDGDGEVVKDIIAYGNRQISEAANAIDGSKVLQIIQALPSFQPDSDADNMYTITLDGQTITGPLGGPQSTGGNTIYEKLMEQTVDENGAPTGQLRYAKDVEALYNKFNGYLNPGKDAQGFEISPEEAIKNIAADYPDLAFDLQTYQRLKGGFSAVNNNQTKLNNIVRDRGKHLHDQYQLAKESGLYEGYDDVVGFIEEGLDIDIFKQNGDSWNIKSKEEFIDEYVQGAREGKFKDDLGWWSRNTWFGKDSGHDANYMGDEYEYVATGSNYGGSYRVSTGRKIFYTDEAKEDAAMLYDHMYTMLNNTQNGSYTGEAEQIRDLGKNESAAGIVPTRNQNTFSTFDVGRAMRGKQPQGTVADLISSPTYTLDVNPFTINQDVTAAGLVSDMIRQYDVATAQQMTIQPGNLGTIEDADLNAATDVIAAKLLESYFREIKGWSSSPKSMSKSNPAMATISYNPTFGSAGDVSGDHAAYVISLPGEWVKDKLGYLTAGGQNGQAITAAEAAKYQTITFAFDDDVDVSDRREGAYNYSNTMAQINSTDNQQYFNSIANGGSVRVNQDVNGQYIGYVKFQQYNPQTGGFDTLPEQSFNLNEFVYNNTGTQDMMSYLDGAVKYMEILVEDKMQSNKKLLEETNASQNAQK